MNSYKEIDFPLILTTIKIKFIYILIVTIICTAFGLIMGVIYIKFISTSPTLGSDDIPSVNLQDIEYDTEYFSQDNVLLNENISNINKHLDTILSIESENTNEVMELRESIAQLIDSDLSYLNLLIEETPYPADFLREAERDISVELSALHAQLSELQSLQDILSEFVFIPENTDISYIYAEEFEKIMQIPQLQTQMSYYNDLTNSFQSNVEYKKQSDELEQLLDDCFDDLNTFISEYNRITDELSVNNNININVNHSVVDGITVPNLSIIHTYHEPNDMEDMLSFTVFFALFGIVIGFLICLVKVAKIK